MKKYEEIEITFTYFSAEDSLAPSAFGGEITDLEDNGDPLKGLFG